MPIGRVCGAGQGMAVDVPEVGVRQYLSQEAQGFVSFEAIRRGQVFAEQMFGHVKLQGPWKTGAIMPTRAAYAYIDL